MKYIGSTYRIPRATTALPALLLLGTLVSPADTLAQRRAWTVEDRFLVGEGGLVTALALGTREVYATTADGIIVYDFVERRWRPPLTLVEGYPLRTSVTALAYDRVSGGLWIGTGEGELLSYTPGFGRWERHPLNARGEILALAAHAASGSIYVATARQWLRTDAMSSFADPVTPDGVPEDVRTVLERTRGRDPVLDAVRGTLGVDDDLRQWTITDAIPGERPGEFFVATAGGGILRFDSRGLERDWLTYGLLTGGTSALGFDGERLWFGGDGRGPRDGVASATASLEQWSHHEAAMERAPAGFVAEIMTSTDGVWFAASDGAYLRSVANDDDRRGSWRRWTSSDGLPTDEVTALARADDVTWIGTRRGVAAIEDGNVVARLVGAPVHRLAARNDTLWIAGEDGLWIVARAGTNPRRAASEMVPGTEGNPALTGRVADIVATPETVIAMAGDALYSYDGTRWTMLLRDANLDRIGPPLRLAYDADRLWVAGGNGIASRSTGSNGWVTFEVPADIPVGPALDVLPVGDDVWIATPVGAVRLRWN